MQPSMFNVRVPLDDRNEVFLMNTFTDAQLIVSSDVAALLDRVDQRRRLVRRGAGGPDTLAENGFIVESRDADRGRRSTSTSAGARKHGSSCASRC